MNGVAEILIRADRVFARGKRTGSWSPHQTFSIDPNPLADCCDGRLLAELQDFASLHQIPKKSHAQSQPHNAAAIASSPQDLRKLHQGEYYNITEIVVSLRDLELSDDKKFTRATILDGLSFSASALHSLPDQL
jgi:hypothetical protein